MASYVVQGGRHKGTLPCATLHCTLWETMGQITLGYITLYKVGDTGTNYTGVHYTVHCGRHWDKLPCATLHCTLWETLGQITLGYITLYKVGDTGTNYTGVRYTGTLWIWTNRSKSSWQPCCKCPETKRCQGICNHSNDFSAMECHMNHIDGIVPERRNSTALATQ